MGPLITKSPLCQRGNELYFPESSTFLFLFSAFLFPCIGYGKHGVREELWRWPVPMHPMDSEKDNMLPHLCLHHRARTVVTKGSPLGGSKVTSRSNKSKVDQLRQRAHRLRMAHIANMDILNSAIRGRVLNPARRSRMPSSTPDGSTPGA